MSNGSFIETGKLAIPAILTPSGKSTVGVEGENLNKKRKKSIKDILRIHIETGYGGIEFARARYYIY